MKICSVPLPVPSKCAPVPEAFDGWFARAMQRDPERRFQSAREMAEALAGLVPHGAARKTVQSEIFRQNAGASPWSQTRSGEAPDGKRIAIIALLAALSTIVLVSGVLWLISSRRGGEDQTQTTPQGQVAPSGSPQTTAQPATPGSATPIVSPSATAKEPGASDTPAESPTTTPSTGPAPSTAPTTGPHKGPKGPRRAEDVFGI
jgi:serine/threonine-protein kinase